MAGTVVIPGRIVDTNTVQLDSPAPADAKTARVVIDIPGRRPRLGDILRALPPGGTRSEEDIDQQIEDERAAWDE